MNTETLKHFTPDDEELAREYLTTIFQSANKEIMIADKYLDATLFGMIDDIIAPVKIRLMTWPSRYKSGFSKILKDHNQTNITCRIDETGLFEKYILIDGETLYTISVSFNAMSKSDFSIEKLEDPDMILSLKNLWSNAKELI